MPVKRWICEIKKYIDLYLVLAKYFLLLHISRQGPVIISCKLADKNNNKKSAEVLMSFQIFCISIFYLCYQYVSKSPSINKLLPYFLALGIFPGLSN